MIGKLNERKPPVNKIKQHYIETVTEIWMNQNKTHLNY